MQSVLSASLSQRQEVTSLPIHHQHRTSEIEISKNLNLSMANERNLLSVQCSNNISDANQSSFPSAPMQLISQSTPSPIQRFTPAPIQRFTASPIQRSTLSSTPRSTPSSVQPSTPLKEPVSEIDDPSTLAKTLNTASFCFIETKRPIKKTKVDPIETAFFQMNNTLNTVAFKVLQNRNDNDVHDPDVIVDKLVTAELNRTMEPMKSNLKKKFMKLLYSHNE